MCRLQRPTRHITGHFRDESFQAINCTGTDNQKQSNTTLHTPETQRGTEKTALANKTNYTLIWYGFTTSGQETEWALFLQPRSPHGAAGWEMSSSLPGFGYEVKA